RAALGFAPRGPAQLPGPARGHDGPGQRLADPTTRVVRGTGEKNPRPASSSSRCRRVSVEPCPLLRGADLRQQRLAPRMALEAALDHLPPELDVRPVARPGLEGDDRVAHPVDDVAARQHRAALSREPPAAELGQRCREIADMRRLVLLDELDEGPRLVVPAEELRIAQYRARPAERLDGEHLDDEDAR